MRNVTLLILIMAMWAGTAGAENITLDTTNSNTLAHLRESTSANTTGTAVAYVWEYHPVSGLPFIESISESPGDGSLHVNVDYSDSEFWADFSGTRIAQKWSGTYAHGTVRFTVSVPTDYLVSGFLNASGDGGDCAAPEETCELRLLSTLVEFDGTFPVTFRFYEEARSLHTPNDSFVLGQNHGDEYQRHEGSMTGVLYPGVQYTWAWQMKTYTSDTNVYWPEIPVGSDTGSSASGEMRFELTPVEGPHTATACDMDYNNDGAIGFDDLGLQVACAAETGPCQDEMDTNNNTIVNTGDIQYVLANVGASCP